MLALGALLAAGINVVHDGNSGLVPPPKTNAS